MNAKEIMEKYDQFVMHTYAPGEVIARGKGCKVFNPKKNSYLDFTAGISVHNVGHCHPKVVEAITAQVANLGHCSNLFVNEPQVQLAERLSALGLGGKCFFCNSGAEANEAMIKLARLWGADKGKFEVITMVNSFHGRTLGTMAATGQTKIQEGFEPLPVGFAYADFNDLASVEAAVTDQTVAVLVEAVQGEGGVIPATEEFMAGLRQLCDRKGLLLLCDEVQCGLGRTGKLWGWQHSSIRPDAFTVAKSIADGVPMGVLIAKPEYSDVFKVGSHGSTFGGNPLACAAANAVLDVIEEEKLVEQAAKLGELFVEGLKLFVEKYDQVLEIRGRGLMLGMVVEGKAKEVVDKCREIGLLCCVAGEHVVRFLPPLTLKEGELEDALEMIGDALDELYGDAE